MRDLQYAPTWVRDRSNVGNRIKSAEKPSTASSGHKIRIALDNTTRIRQIRMMIPVETLGKSLLCPSLCMSPNAIASLQSRIPHPGPTSPHEDQSSMILDNSVRKSASNFSIRSLTSLPGHGLCQYH